MKIIQSFWTGNKNSLTDSYGWLLPIFNYLSWIISCYQLRRYYDDPTVKDMMLLSTGTDIDFIQRYTYKAFDFVDKNIKMVNRVY